ncbi:MAG: group 1 truncated hemoglobin [Lysobacterales bacterium]
MRLLRPALLAALVIGSACTGNHRADRLYVDLGGNAGLAALVDAVVAELHGDPRIRHLFADTDDAEFKARLTEQLCELAGGGCEYTGLAMAEAHSGMDLSEAQFNYFVEDARRAMTRAGIRIGAQNLLLARLARMRAEVVHQ